ncbi:LacI family DNA-binding transcriptional regulator [Roseibium sp.]|uniref:LacI family DNA-binding transcriptional regulator n=1 Tax=Roseibium sp. TaxID=1936156 RepID=UPI003BAE2818
MHELEYDADPEAGSARSLGEDVVGLIVPDITNPFFAQLAKHIEMEAALRGIMVMLSNSHEDPAIERKQIKAMYDRSISGIIVVSTSDASLPFSTDIPIVSVDRRYGSYPLVTTDQWHGSGMLAEHLHGLGHRHMAYIAGPLETEVARQRRDGFVARVEALSRPEDPIEMTVQSGPFDSETGEAIGREILLSVRKGGRITAIATSCDQQAIGVLRCARDLGVHVPQDVSVIGFDDIAMASLVVPRLTTLRQPIEDLASGALERVLSETGFTTDYAIRGSLVIRESTAPPSEWS